MSLNKKLKLFPPPGGMHLSHEISRRKVRTTRGFKKGPVPQLPRHTDAQQKKKKSTKLVGRRTDSCSWCGSAHERYVSRKTMLVSSCSEWVKESVWRPLWAVCGSAVALGPVYPRSLVASRYSDTLSSCPHFSHKRSLWYNGQFTVTTAETHSRLWGTRLLLTTCWVTKYFTSGWLPETIKSAFPPTNTFPRNKVPSV